jgi:hypothetical protein
MYPLLYLAILNHKSLRFWISVLGKVEGWVSGWMVSRFESRAVTTLSPPLQPSRYKEFLLYGYMALKYGAVFASPMSQSYRDASRKY